MDKLYYLKERYKTIKNKIGINIDIPVKLSKIKSVGLYSHNNIIQLNKNIFKPKKTNYPEKGFHKKIDKWIESVILHEYCHHCLYILYKKWIDKNNKKYFDFTEKYSKVYAYFVGEIIYPNDPNKVILFYDNIFNKTKNRKNRMSNYKMSRRFHSLKDIHEFICGNLDYYYYFDLNKNKLEPEIYDMVKETIKLIKDFQK